MIKTVIDIGSNSIQFLLAEVLPEYKILSRKQFITGLGRDLDKNGFFLQESMDDSFKALQECKEICEQFYVNPNSVMCTGTEASRVSKNAREFYQMVKHKLGFEIKLISGEGEAFLSAKGVLFNNKIDVKEAVIMDIGGASTEVVKIQTSPFHILGFYSFPIGSVRFKNWQEEGILDKKIETVINEKMETLKSFVTPHLICVAGTMTSVANMVLGNKTFKEEEINNQKLTMAQVADLCLRVEKFTIDEYLQNYPFLGKRAAVISGGLGVAKLMLEHLEAKNITISTQGLMHGVLAMGSIPERFILKSE